MDLQPSNVENIKMVSRFIKEENDGLEKHSPGKGKLYFPTARQAANCVSSENLTETSVYNFLLVGEDTLVTEG